MKTYLKIVQKDGRGSFGRFSSVRVWAIDPDQEYRLLPFIHTTVFFGHFIKRIAFICLYVEGQIDGDRRRRRLKNAHLHGVALILLKHRKGCGSAWVTRSSFWPTPTGTAVAFAKWFATWEFNICPLRFARTSAYCPQQFPMCRCCQRCFSVLWLPRLWRWALCWGWRVSLPITASLSLLTCQPLLPTICWRSTSLVNPAICVPHIGKENTVLRARVERVLWTETHFQILLQDIDPDID